MNKFKHYNIALYKRDKFKKEEIQKHLDDEINVETKSVYSARCFVKEKPDESLRIFVHYSELNKISFKQDPHFPSVLYIFYKMINSKYFSELVLKKKNLSNQNS